MVLGKGVKRISALVMVMVFQSCSIREVDLQAEISKISRGKVIRLKKKSHKSYLR